MTDQPAPAQPVPAGGAVRCPLTGSTDVVPVVDVPRADLIALYRTGGIEIDDALPPGDTVLYRNPAIDFSFFEPRRSGSQRFYSRLSETLDYRFEKPEFAFAARNVGPGTVLDVGCGHAFFRTYLPDNQYSGVELSEPSVAYCRAHGVNIIDKPVEDIAREGLRFDNVVSFQVMEHVEDPLAFFAGLVDVARPGGTIIVSVPYAGGFVGAQENNYLNMPPHHLTWWSKESLVYLGRRFGLVLQDYEIDRAERLTDFVEILVRDKINRLFRRRRRLLRPGLFDRGLNFFLRGIGYVLSRNVPPSIMPAGHSITFVWRKP